MAVCLVLVETSTPPPASHAHALTRTRTHVFHSWIISVILLAVKRVQLNHWAWGGGESGHAGLQGCSPVTVVFPREAAQWRVCPSWHLAQKVNGPKTPPGPSIPGVILFKVSRECRPQHRRVFLTSHVMCADTWGAVAQLTD